MLESWGRFVHRFRWAVLAASLLFLAISIGGIMAGGNVGAPSTSTKPLESDRAGDLILTQLRHRKQPISTFDLLFTSRSTNVADASFKSNVDTALTGLRADRRVASIATPFDAQAAPQLVSTDRHTAIAHVTVIGSGQAARRFYQQLRDEVRPTALGVTGTGDLAINHAFDATLEADLQRAEVVSLPIAVLLLVLIFRSVIAAFLPIGVAILTIVGGVAGTLLISRFTSVSQYAFNIVTLIGLGVSIDYSLMVVNRFREELGRGASREDALARTMATAGRAIAFSGLTVAIGLSSLLFFQGSFLTSMGLAGAVVVALAVLYGLTLLPALLAVIGGGVNRLRLGMRAPAAGSGAWYRTAAWVMRRPLVVLAPCLLLLVAAAGPFSQLRMANAGIDSLPPTNEARQGYDRLLHDFPGQAAMTVAVVANFPAASSTDPGPSQAVKDLSGRIAAMPGVLRVEGPETGGHVALLTAVSNLDPSSDAARNIVLAIRTTPRIAAGGQVLVGDQTANDLDIIAFVIAHVGPAVVFVLAVTYLVLFLMTGSVVLPLKAVLTNLLSIAASFGALVWIFQQGHLSHQLNFTAQSLDPTVPVILFAIVFGLSMDYEVFLVTRIQERYRATGDNRLAVAEGLERSGRLITGAAAIMIAVFLAFGLADVVIIKSIGIGMAVAIFLDATIVRALVVPAMMRLMGRFNWWAPSPLARLHRRAGLAETEEAASVEPPRLEVAAG
jgi:RND superfamily putative drug exporter